jgi:hypothetical protein
MAPTNHWQKNRAALGVAAVIGILFFQPRPANAGCIYSGVCTSGGGATFVSDGTTFCSGGTYNGDQVCTAGLGAGGVSGPGTNKRLPGSYPPPVLVDPFADDPFVNFTSIRDSGGSVSSASGTISGQGPASHSTDVGGGAIGTYNGWNKTFNLTANQSLVVGGQFSYDSLRTTFGASPLVPGFASLGSNNEDIYRLNGGLAYYAGSLYFGGTVGGDWGRGNQTNVATGGTGGYGIYGYQTGAFLGNVFTLYGSPGNPANPSNSPLTTKALPAKAPPQPAPPGYALQLDLGAHATYLTDQADGFTDSAGFIWGAEQLHYWDVGGQARLFATIPDGRLTWTPYVTATLDQQLGYSDALALPAQPGQIADTIFFGAPQTFWGAHIGLYAQDVSGIGVGIRGIYQESSEFQILGGQAYIRYVFQ